MAKIYANGFESGDPDDFSRKAASPFARFNLFGNPNVFVQVAAGEQPLPELEQVTTTCERLGIPHLHKKTPQGVFECTLPKTLEELGG